MAIDILLCHFCEIHGPSVVFRSLCVDGSKLQEQELTDRLIRFSLAAEADLIQDDDPFDEGDLFLFEDNSARTSAVECCEGCSLHANTAKCDIVSFNDEQNRCFLSEDFSSRSALSDSAPETSSLRVTCLRSMSSELHPKNQGGIYFSTEQNEHVVSFLFSLQDSKSRGFQRKYSIFVLYDKEKHPFTYYNLLIKNITLIIANLQKKAKAVFKSELKPDATLKNRSIILDKVASAGKNLNYFEELFDRDPSNTSKNKIKARSLGEITGDSNIFYTLHLQFASILAEILRRDEANAQRETQSSLFNLNDVGLITDFFSSDSNSKLRKLFTLTGSANFLLIASNVVLGNRVIVFDANQKGRTKQVVAMLAKLLPQERIEIQTEAQFDSQCLSPNDSNLLGVCAKFQSDDMDKLIQDFYMCVEICDKVDGAAVVAQSRQPDDDLTPGNCTLKLHCCDEIARVAVPTYVKKVEELLRVIFISDLTLNKRIDEMKFEWMNKSRMFLKNAPLLNSAEVGEVKRVFNIADDDLQMMQFWSKAFLNK